MSLAYYLDNPSDVTIVGEKGSYGKLNVNLIPTDIVTILYYFYLIICLIYFSKDWTIQYRRLTRGIRTVYRGSIRSHWKTILF